VRRLIEHSYNRARQILEKYMDQLHNLAAALMEYETLEEDEIDLAMAGKKIHRPSDGDSRQPPEPPTAPAAEESPHVAPDAAGQGA